MLKLSILILSLVTFVSSVQFQCTYTSENRCKVISGQIWSKSDATVTSVFGYQKRDVTGFDGRSQTFKYFPRNLADFFPRVTEIFIERGLLEIHKEDLQQYPQLKWLYLSNNELTEIEKDLFIYTPYLRLIFLGGNKIKYIHSDVFDHLNSLDFLATSGNPCYSGQSENNRSGVLNLISNIKKHCSEDSCVAIIKKALESIRAAQNHIKNSNEVELSGVFPNNCKRGGSNTKDCQDYLACV